VRTSVLYVIRRGMGDGGAGWRGRRARWSGDSAIDLTLFSFGFLHFEWILLFASHSESGSGALNYSGRSPLLMVEQGRPDPCLVMVYADTDNPVC